MFSPWFKHFPPASILLPTVTPTGILNKAGLQAVVLSKSCQALTRKIQRRVNEAMETSTTTQGMVLGWTLNHGSLLCAGILSWDQLQSLQPRSCSSDRRFVLSKRANVSMGTFLLSTGCGGFSKCTPAGRCFLFQGVYFPWEVVLFCVEFIFVPVCYQIFN